MFGAINADMAACGLWLLPLRRSGVGSLERFQLIHPPPLPLNAMPDVDATIQDGRMLPEQTQGARRTKATFQGHKAGEIS